MGQGLINGPAGLLNGPFNPQPAVQLDAGQMIWSPPNYGEMARVNPFGWVGISPMYTYYQLKGTFNNFFNAPMTAQVAATQPAKSIVVPQNPGTAPPIVAGAYTLVFDNIG